MNIKYIYIYGGCGVDQLGGIRFLLGLPSADITALYTDCFQLATSLFDALYGPCTSLPVGRDSMRRMRGRRSFQDLMNYCI